MKQVFEGDSIVNSSGLSRLAICVALAAGMQGNLHAQGAATAPCAAGAHAQFDFWIGQWDVYGSSGGKVGTNRISKKLGNCVLHEHWQGAGGVEGESFNVHVAARNVWHQTWVDNRGNLLQLEGGLQGSDMVLSDRHVGGKRDPAVINQVRWSPLADGSVRQHWQRSADAGSTWTTVFDGLYRKALPGEPKP